jgi:hypothetical protein
MLLKHFAAALSAVSLLSFAAAACSERAEPDAAQGEATTTPAPPIESTALPDDAIATPAAQSAPIAAADRGEQGAKSVLSAWADALENRDFAAARALSGDGATSEAAYAAQFAEYRKIVVSFGEGRIEGAAGSLYYEVPINFTGILANGTPIRRSGTIVLRRANDVPGATPEQLHWRIYRTTLQV